MALLVPDAGEVAMLDSLLKTASPEPLTLKLYSNNYDAVEGSIAGSFTEATIAGYASKALARATWGGASSAAGVTTSTYGTPQVFNFTGTGTVVGYYIVGTSSGTIYWAERLYAATGQTFNNGDSLTITPKITLE
jgi:hypothetical protein